MLSGGYNLRTQRLAVLDSLRELSASSLQSHHEPRKFRDAASPQRDANHDILGALERWVEVGVARKRSSRPGLPWRTKARL